MIISFDLDNTLIPYSNEFEVEPKTLFAKLLQTEPLREGTINLFHELENRGHELWIYTTSFRSSFKIKLLFKVYGLQPTRIINQTINLKKLDQLNCHSSKNPNLFGIDIHIDDAKGVGMEAEKYGFKTIIISTEDKNWTKTILQEVEKYQK